MKTLTLKARPFAAQRINHLASKLVVGGLLFGTALSAQAQQGGPGGGGGGGNRPNWQNMTPEQRAAMEERRNAARQQWLRQAMTASGVTDAAAQTIVIDYMMAQEKSKVSLQAMAVALSDTLSKPESTGDAIKVQLAAYRAAVAAADKATVDGLAALDKQVKYSTTPRVEALLTLLGVLGPETMKLGGIGSIFPDSPYGNARGGGAGRRGGGQGGGGGGQGGGAPQA